VKKTSPSWGHWGGTRYLCYRTGEKEGKKETVWGEMVGGSSPKKMGEKFKKESVKPSARVLKAIIQPSDTKIHTKGENQKRKGARGGVKPGSDTPQRWGNAEHRMRRTKKEKKKNPVVNELEKKKVRCHHTNLKCVQILTLTQV